MAKHGTVAGATFEATTVAPIGAFADIGNLLGPPARSRPRQAYLPCGIEPAQPFGAWRQRVEQWLSREAFPVWSRASTDSVGGGFFEALDLTGKPLAKLKRMRTMARQIYAFAVAAERGWSDAAGELAARGLDFIAACGRSPAGGWVRTLNCDGSVADPAEDAYDTACVLLALAQIHRCGDRRAIALAGETQEFLDRFLRDDRFAGFLETSGGGVPRRSNPHMHMLEAFLAWYDATGDPCHLERAAGIVELFKRRFFDVESWTVGEYFRDDWSPAAAEAGERTEPGHHFEWAALLVAFALRSGQLDLWQLARKIYSTAVAGGSNRTTGLAFAAVSRSGRPLETVSRSWPQAEAIKAAIAIDQTGGPDLKPEIEARVARLFRWHIDPAPAGLWIDRVDEIGALCAVEVPASILYHLVGAFTQYLDYTEPLQSAAVQAGDLVPAAE